MNLQDIENKKIAILGFGQEGQAVATYLVKKGMKPKIFDKKPLDEWSEGSLALLHQLDIAAAGGADYLDQATNESEVVFRSPGVKIPQLQLQKMTDKSIQLTSQAAWFFEHCPSKIIGVTGTKGKGTTCTLLEQILQKAISKQELNGRVFLTGNIGKIQPFEFLEVLTEQDWIVYELSSFQLQNLKKSPHLGICLMVTEDHLDYHSDLEDYHQAKSAISKYQKEDDFQIYNIDYPATKQIGEQGRGQKWQVSKMVQPEHGAKIGNEQVLISGVGKEEIYIPTNERLLPGKHNLENIAAASLTAVLLQVKPQTIAQVIREFHGLKHRLQFVTEKNEVKYYNDSISTIPDTTIAALDSFSDPIVLLVGGATKNLSNEKLVDKLMTAKNLRAIVTVGQTGAEISKELQQAGYNKVLTGPFNDFEEAVSTAKTLAQRGDIVLLSPAATSFDMFTSYADRGEQFINLVS